MKKIVLGSFLAIAATMSLSAHAATVCTKGVPAGQIAAGNFVKVPFDPKCSSQVFLSGVDQSSTIYAVGAGSAKGKKLFAGTTAGGAIVPSATECPTSGCTAALVDTEATTVATAAAAS